ncbi:MAG: alpha/beta fold hydrolase [Actinobacteria bacterium]|nr:alpha/beta fold hydrolase [Actinomycetota bacterium]
MAILNAQVWGEPGAEPVVCLHGVTGHSGRFGGLAGRLADRRVLAFDLRGHGRSTWEAPWDVETHLEDLRETADSLGAGRATWLGHSFGGRLVAHLAERDPDRVERAILLDPAMHAEPALASERAAGLRDDVSFASPDEAVDTRLADGSLFSTPRELLEEEATAHLARGDDDRYRWRYSPTAVIVAWSEMATPAPPWPACETLVVVGAQSWIPLAVPRLPHLRSLPVPGGHSVLWDDFELVADAVADFLR